MFDHIIGVMMVVTGYLAMTFPRPQGESFWVSLIVVICAIMTMLYGLVVVFNGF